jgi:UDP-N-acetylglucosamine acyltransferase
MKQPLAYVHPESVVADNVVIEPFVTIDKDVIIGEGTRIGSNVTILPGTRIGKTVIFSRSSYRSRASGPEIQGRVFSTVEIGNNTTIREFVTINRGTSAKGKTVVGDNCLLMAYVHVAHDCVVGNNVILVNNTQLAGEVIVDDYAILAGMVAVHQFVHVGSHVMIAGGSLVRKDVPPFIKAGREPLAYVGHKLHWSQKTKLFQRKDQGSTGYLSIYLSERVEYLPGSGNY